MKSIHFPVNTVLPTEQRGSRSKTLTAMVLLPTLLFMLLLASSVLLELANATDEIGVISHRLVADGGNIQLRDISTGFSDLQTVLLGDAFSVEVLDVWTDWSQESPVYYNKTESYLEWTLHVNDERVSTGWYRLDDTAIRQNEPLNVGNATLHKGGRNTVQVELRLVVTELLVDNLESLLSSDQSTDSPTIQTNYHDFSLNIQRDYMAYSGFWTLSPIFIVMLLAVWLRIMELALFGGILLGSCMIHGSFRDGFVHSIMTYLMDSIVHRDNAMVLAFLFILGGLTAVMEKSGGMKAFGQWVASMSTASTNGQKSQSSRSSRVLIQLYAMASSALFYFDDYTSYLVVGSAFRGAFQDLGISAEKLALILNTTASAMGNLLPLTSWLGFELSLISTELSKIAALESSSQHTEVPTSALSVILQSIRYQFVPVLTLFIVFLLIVADRDYGPMLIVERKAQLRRHRDNQRSSGQGEKSAASQENEHGSRTPLPSETEPISSNAPDPETPCRVYNLAVPSLVLLSLIILVFFLTGRANSPDNAGFVELLEHANPFQALLIGSVSATLLVVLFYRQQIKKSNRLYFGFPAAEELMAMYHSKLEKRRDEVEEPSTEGITEEKPEEEFNTKLRAGRSLLSLQASFKTFVLGMEQMFPNAPLLVLSWTLGSVIEILGANRFFAGVLSGIRVESLPAAVFGISALMSCAIGGETTAILFPLVMTPAWLSANGDMGIFYASISGIFAGSVAGEQGTPLSDNVVLTSAVSRCSVCSHAATQAAYVYVASAIGVVFGYIAVGWGWYSLSIAYVVCIGVLSVFIALVAKPIDSSKGTFDPLTDAYIRLCGNTTELYTLKEEIATTRVSVGPTTTEFSSLDCDEESQPEVQQQHCYPLEWSC